MILWSGSIFRRQESENYLEWNLVSCPSCSGMPSFSRTSSISISDTRTPKSLMSHVSYLSGMTLTLGSWGLARLDEEEDCLLSVVFPLSACPVCCFPTCWVSPPVEPCNGRATSWVIGDFCGPARSWGSGGSVTTGSEVSLRFACVRVDCGDRVGSHALVLEFGGADEEG